ncbi:alpha/beta fold hydrolase [Catenuloplanes sp. NPDC051500]|uniref:alpha/beta fold hydrolase n=1 Tax=Catenuloplanes sp. NPDC051500 TaxID=3363959 RepID=UPI0037A16412
MTDLLLVHGLTYDHRTWGPLRDELGPEWRVRAVDLPGHGDAPRLGSYAMRDVVEVVHEQAKDLTEPIVVGHSVGAIIATAYAAAYPAAAVLNLDQPLLLGPFGAAVRAAEPVLRGPDWRTVWDRMLAGMGIDALPDDARRLVETATDPRPDLLLGYWGEILRHSDAEIAEQRRAELAAIAARGIGYHLVTGSEPPAAYLAWLTNLVPDAGVTVLPGGHFPHLAHPAAVARILAALRAGRRL